MQAKRGKKTGHVKSQVTIKDEMMTPYYLSMDENQYTLMVEGSTLPLGYYASFERALKRIARYKTLESLTQQSVDLNTFMSEYKNITEKLTNKFEA